MEDRINRLRREDSTRKAAAAAAQAAERQTQIDRDQATELAEREGRAFARLLEQRGIEKIDIEQYATGTVRKETLSGAWIDAEDLVPVGTLPGWAIFCRVQNYNDSPSSYHGVYCLSESGKVLYSWQNAIDERSSPISRATAVTGSAALKLLRSDAFQDGIASRLDRLGILRAEYIEYWS